MSSKVNGVNELLRLIELFCGSVCRGVFEKLVRERTEFIDEHLANHLGVNVNDVRKSLYELQSLGLVTYTRIRDPTDGRFIYYWRADVGHLNQLLLQRKRTVLRKLEERLMHEESNSFYTCPHDGIRLTFNEALENDFKCPRCGSPLEFYDNSAIVRRLRELISRLQEEIRDEERNISS